MFTLIIGQFYGLPSKRLYFVDLIYIAIWKWLFFIRYIPRELTKKQHLEEQEIEDMATLEGEDDAEI